jgi:hypothetical protein
VTEEPNDQFDVLVIRSVPQNARVAAVESCKIINILR